MELWIARDADGELWLFRVDPIWVDPIWLGGLWDMRYGVEANELSRDQFPDLPPGHKQRV